MRLPLKRILAILLAFIVLLVVAFKIYRRIQTRNQIEETLASDHWITRFDDFLSEPRTKGGIIFLGNSLTERFNLSVFNDSTIINRGIDGDFTEGLLKRIDEVNSLHPSKLFIEIGINDIFAKVPPGKIIENYEKIIERIKKKSPQTKIYIQSNLPVLREGNLTSCAELNKIITEQNERLKKLATKYGLTYINLYDHFVKNGALNPQLSFDGVHITKSGYEIWKETLIPYLKD